MSDDQRLTPDKRLTRQEFLIHCGRGASLLALGGAVGLLASRHARSGQVWQIDPNKCAQCGQCATHCVLDQSAVKCFHTFPMCGYCELCTGFFEPEPNALNEGAENQLCPVGAIQRRFVEDPYFEYVIDEDLCTACGRCVKGCVQFGNGSLYLQVRHDLCLNCNECAIAAHCPSDAFVRLPATAPYFQRLTNGG
jgi:electron transport complex protein RnfB